MGAKGLISLLLLFFVNNVFAQSSDVVDASEINKESAKIEVEESEVTTQEETIAKKKKSSKVERIEVTGSYVRRIDVEGPSPVVTINKEDFEEAGVDTINDYLRESPLFSGSTDSGDRDGYFRFRGQHAGSTLVLLNGMRMPVLGGTSSRGFYNGVESIPTNIIDRVEILKDGSSALYGSDAMAGVVNFITKKDYDGAEYSNRINIPELGVGLQQNHTIAFGKSYDNASWFLTTQFVEQQGYTQKDVNSYFQAATTRNGSNGSFTNHWNEGGKGFKGRTEFGPGCPPGATDGCFLDNRDNQYIRDPRQNLGTMLAGTVDFNADMQWNMAAMYNRRTRTDRGAVDFINLDQTTGLFIDPATLDNNPSLQSKSDNGKSMSLAYRPIDEIGQRRVDVLQNAYTVQTQLRNYFGDTWKWEIGGAYGYTLEERDWRNGLVELNGVLDAIQNGFDPTNVSQSNAGALQNAQVFGTEAYEATMTNARFLATGEMFDFRDVYNLGGPASIAFGIEGQWENSKDAHDEFLTEGTFSRVFGTEQGSRNVNSVFSELVMYPIDSLEFQAAGRLDNYSDWGSTFNPKFALGFRPSNKMLLRASWGTNFKAPSVRNMIASPSQEFHNLDMGPDLSRQFGVPVTRYRYDELGPEKAINYNFGTVIQPNKAWTITIDQWNFEGTDTITRFGRSDFNRVYEAFSQRGNADELMESLGVFIDRNPDGTINRIDAPHVFNMGRRTIRGIDLGTKFYSPIRLFGRVLKFGAGFDHTHMLVHKTRDADLVPVRNRADLEWKNTISASIKTKDHSYRLAARTLAGDTSRFTATRTHTEYDFNYGWGIPWWAGRVQLGVKNLFNTEPPVPRDREFVRFDGGFNAYAFNALGRRYYVGYSQSF